MNDNVNILCLSIICYSVKKRWTLWRLGDTLFLFRISVWLMIGDVSMIRDFDYIHNDYDYGMDNNSLDKFSIHLLSIQFFKPPHISRIDRWCRAMYLLFSLKCLLFSKFRYPCLDDPSSTCNLYFSILSPFWCVNSMSPDTRDFSVWTWGDSFAEGTWLFTLVV